MYINNISKTISQILWNDGAVKIGDFKLSSGKRSRIYIDMRTILGYPRDFSWIISALASIAGIIERQYEIECIVGIATGGLAWSVPVALSLSLPFAYHRGKKKEYGLANVIEGCNVKGKNVLIVDDVVTTGSSIISTFNDIKMHEGSARVALVIVDRCQGAYETLIKEGLTLYSLTNLYDIIETGVELKFISKNVADELLKEVHCRSWDGKAET